MMMLWICFQFCVITIFTKTLVTQNWFSLTTFGIAVWAFYEVLFKSVIWMDCEPFCCCKKERESFRKRRRISQIVIWWKFIDLFQPKISCNFWVSVADKYPLFLERAIKIELPFATAYHMWCVRLNILALTNMKTKSRSRLSAESDLRVCLSQIAPRIDKLCTRKQPHPSHWFCQCL